MVLIILLNFLFDFYIIYGPLCRPCNPQNFKELMDVYIRLCTGMLSKTLSFFILWFCTLSTYKFKFLGLSDLSRKIMRGISLALTGSPEEFEGGRAGDAFWVMRIIGYPGVPTADGPGPTNDIGW